MGISTGRLDRRITFMLGASQDDGLATVPGELVPIGTRWASREDVTDVERIRAAQNGQELTARFVVLWDSLTRTINGRHSFTCEGVTYAVVGTKEVGGRHVGIEITAHAQPDLTP